jgi:cytochrome P450
VTTTSTLADSRADLLARFADPAARADPYPVLAALRDLGPGVVSGRPVAVAARWADVAALLRDPRLSSSPDLPGSAPETRRRRAFLFLDPPDHTRLRRLVSSAFTPRVVEALRPRVEALVEELLDAVPAGGRDGWDLVAGLAHPMPVVVICELLGVPPRDVERFRQWSTVLAEGLDPLFAPVEPTPERLAAQAGASAALQEYLHGIVAARRADPGDDLISALIAVRDAGDTLTDAELLGTCGLLLLAGHETAVNLVANGTLALLRSPGQLDALRADPGRAARVVDEVLRTEPPFQLVTRLAVDDVELDGAVIPRGHRVALLLAAANRDPERFADPDRFDPDRTDGRHLGFGAGAHFCLGAPLARLEGEIALAALARRAGGLELVAEPPYKPNVTLRGPRAVVVRTAGAGGAAARA